ncbi:hypothetical protein CDCA_CDCA14G3749 [Cyanidium caldarium]|uniref:Uncharacterized protein n=1 Tax=Cyanidium caldarium TaxID=2771 RepID=A0AAV9J070_CYACA|nr:hypothetical protein CDCA_CDCA14G3749 [Cyanidium caldarium]
MSFALAFQTPALASRRTSRGSRPEDCQNGCPRRCRRRSPLVAQQGGALPPEKRPSDGLNFLQRYLLRRLRERLGKFRLQGQGRLFEGLEWAEVATALGLGEAEQRRDASTRPSGSVGGYVQEAEVYDDDDGDDDDDEEDDLDDIVPPGLQPAVGNYTPPGRQSASLGESPQQRRRGILERLGWGLFALLALLAFGKVAWSMLAFVLRLSFSLLAIFALSAFIFLALVVIEL